MKCEFLVDLPSKYVHSLLSTLWVCFLQRISLNYLLFKINYCRGLLKHVQAGSAFTSPPPLYIAVHSTNPPKGQVVSTDQSSLLIRCLQSKKKAKGDPSGSRKGKRQADEQVDARSRKRAQEESQAGGSSVRTIYSEDALDRMTVKELQSILYEKRQPVSGRKADLIERVLNCQ